MERLAEVLGKLKRARPAPVACPRCGSLTIRRSGPLNGWVLPSLYLCDECGYAGRLVLELEEDRSGGTREER